MHNSSMDRMSEFVDKYLDRKKVFKILDIGSCCRHPSQDTYKKFFNNPSWEYFGMDIEAGHNVDLIANDIYDWGIEPLYYDVIISGQCLEHVKDVKKWIQQINDCLKREGLVCIIAPWTWRQHRYPFDCWRILPDGMEFLLKDVCGFQILDIFTKENDCIGIAKKSGI